MCTLIKAGGFFSLFKFVGNNSISCKNFSDEYDLPLGLHCKILAFFGSLQKCQCIFCPGLLQLLSDFITPLKPSVQESRMSDL